MKTEKYILTREKLTAIIDLYLALTQDIEEYEWEFGIDFGQRGDIGFYRTSLEEKLQTNFDMFTNEDLQKMKKADSIILNNIEDACLWIPTPVSKYKKEYWWEFVHKIKNGTYEKPNLDEIYKPYFEKVL